MKKDNQTKSFSSEDYLAELRRNNMYGVKYYNDLERVFANNKMIDLFLVKVDYEKFMEDAKNNYEEELIRNEKFNELLKINPSEKNLNNKMKSDNLLTIFKNNIMEASSKYSNHELEPYVGGAIVIKTGKTCQIFIIALLV